MGVVNAAVAAAPPQVTDEVIEKCINAIRFLSIDGVESANSGHPGLPMGCAPMAYVLWNEIMNHNPSNPKWINRDRFILSAGHGSMFLYSWLNLAGFDLPMEELKNFRQHHSMTPGHPEFPSSEHNTPGVECTTGPLGQGVSNAVGFAASEKMAAAIYNTDDHKIIDHNIFVLAGDGCFQEGVSSEAACFAAHEKLDNLIVLYDANEVTLDKMAEYTQSEDILKRYEAYGWDVYDIDGHDLAVVEETIAAAKASKNGKPKFVKCNTIIGKGMEETEGTNAAHGEAGVPYVDKAKVNIGLPEGEKWYVSEGTRSFFGDVQSKNEAKYNEWQSTFSAWKEANPKLAEQLDNAVNDKIPSAQEMVDAIPATGVEAAEATRVSGKDAIQEIAKLVASLAELSAVSYILTHDSIGVGEDGPTHQPVE